MYFGLIWIDVNKNDEIDLTLQDRQHMHMKDEMMLSNVINDDINHMKHHTILMPGIVLFPYVLKLYTQYKW